MRARVEVVIRERERVASAIGSMRGFEVSPSQANFLWIATPRSARDAYEALVAKGILVRSFHKAGGRMADRLRVTIGAPDENDWLLDALATL